MRGRLTLPLFLKIFQEPQALCARPQAERIFFQAPDLKQPQAKCDNVRQVDTHAASFVARVSVVPFFADQAASRCSLSALSSSLPCLSMAPMLPHFL